MAETKRFYDFGSDVNICYAANIALEKYIAKNFLNDDLTRVIYASTEFALRKRSAAIKYSNLDLPFINYKVRPIDPYSTGRPSWANNQLATEGVYEEALGKKVLAIPVTINYDSTFFIHRDDETHFLYNKLSWDTTLETKLILPIEIDGLAVPIIGVIKYNLDFDPDYIDKDWLEKNKIHTISLDMTIDTFFIKLNSSFSITETFILDFVRGKIGDSESVEDVMAFTKSYFNS